MPPFVFHDEEWSKFGILLPVLTVLHRRQEEKRCLRCLEKLETATAQEIADETEIGINQVSEHMARMVSYQLVTSWFATDGRVTYRPRRQKLTRWSWRRRLG